MPFWVLRLLLCGILALPTAGFAVNYDQYDDIYAYTAVGWHHWHEREGGSGAHGIKVRLGQQLHDFFGIEAQIGLGGSNEGIRLDRLFGLYTQLRLPLDRFIPYGKLGVASVALSSDEARRSEFGFSYGVGVQWAFAPQFFIDAEYLLYAQTDDLDMDGFTLSLGYRLP